MLLYQTTNFRDKFTLKIRKNMIMTSPELTIEGSKTMPTISFKSGKLRIMGRSIPSDSRRLYDPLFHVLYLYSQDPEENTEIEIQLEYLNSDSNRSLMNLLILAEKLHRRGKNVVIKWFYKNNDNVMFDQGHIFKSLIDVPFSFELIN
jgi:hypothetical protein